MPLLQNILLWQSLAMLMLHKLEVCFDQLSWAVKYRFSADPWELAGEQLLEPGGQKPERVAGTGLGLACLSPVNGRACPWPGWRRGVSCVTALSRYHSSARALYSLPSLCIKLLPFICTSHVFVQASLFPSPAFLLRYTRQRPWEKCSTWSCGSRSRCASVDLCEGGS